MSCVLFYINDFVFYNIRIFLIIDGTILSKYMHIYICIYSFTEQEIISSLNYFFILNQCIFIPDSLKYVLKLSIHALLIFEWRTNHIKLLYHQSKGYFIIGIINPISYNTNSVIKMTRSIYQLN